MFLKLRYDIINSTLSRYINIDITKTKRYINIIYLQNKYWNLKPKRYINIIYLYNI